MKKRYFSHFQTYSFLCCSPKELEIMHHMLVITPLFRIINDQVMEVEASNLTACNLAQKLLCLDIEGGKFDVYTSAESATDKRFLQSLKKSTTFSSSLVIVL